MDLGLRGRVALVTGASQGLGRAVALVLAREGCRLVVSSRRPDAIERAAGEIRDETGSEVMAVAADVGVAEDVNRLVAAAVEGYGGIDVLVANAGGPRAGAFAALSDEDWAAALGVTLMGTIRLIRGSVASMRQRGGGRIAVIASSGVREPIEGLVLSNAVRGGIPGLIKNLAWEYGRDGILCNVIAPGRFATPRVEDLDRGRAQAAGASLSQWRSSVERGIAVGRYGEPEELGRAVAFAVSWANTYMTGHTLLVDGGLTRGVW